MTDQTHDDVIKELEEMLDKLGSTEAQLGKINADVTRKTNAIRAQYAGPTDALTKQRAELVASIKEKFQDNRELLTAGSGKTVTLRGGTLSARWSKPALVIDDETKLQMTLRKLGKWALYSKRQPRKLDRTALKDDIALINQLPDDAARLERNENLIIKLPKLKIEIKEVLHPLRARLNDRS